MENYWVKFKDGTAGFCNGSNEHDAKRIAAHFHEIAYPNIDNKIISIQRIPYPAKPIIWQFEHPVYGKCPPFCYKPNECSGRTSCPQRRACSE